MKALLLILVIASPAFGQTRRIVGPPKTDYPVCRVDMDEGTICRWVPQFPCPDITKLCDANTAAGEPCVWPSYVQTFLLGVPDGHVARKVAIVLGDQVVPSGPPAPMSSGSWYVRADGLICAQSPGFGGFCWTFLTP